MKPYVKSRVPDTFTQSTERTCCTYLAVGCITIHTVLADIDLQVFVCVCGVSRGVRDCSADSRYFLIACQIADNNRVVKLLLHRKRCFLVKYNGSINAVNNN